MENFETQKYRDGLAKEIKQEPDKEKRREILATAKSTEEYQKFERFKREEERPFWGKFTEGEIDEVGEYKEPTPEQKEKFKKRIERVSEVFEGADFRWRLDGASNISLYGDKLIRDHNDLDIGIFQEDLVKLDELLSKQGFGIFVNFEEGGRRLMRRVTIKELLTLNERDLSICKIDPSGKIQKETTEPFNFVDLHVEKRDIEGSIVSNLPKFFFDPIKKKLPNGKEINLSQPVLVAYHKLHSNRPHDLVDLQKLKSHLQKKDFSMLRESLEKELEATEKITRKKLQEAWESLMPVLELTCDQKVISEKLWEYPDLQKHRKDQKVSDFVFSISQHVSENPDVTFEGFLNQSLAILRPREQVGQKLKVIDWLEKS